MIRACRVCVYITLLSLLISATNSAQQRREREPNAAYAARRAALAAQVDTPIVLWGFTGREEVSQTYIFSQEYDFYYLTGHNEEGADCGHCPRRAQSQPCDPTGEGPDRLTRDDHGPGH